MKKLLFVSLAIACAFSASAQRFAVKNNLLYDAAQTPNLGVEFKLSKKSTLDISGNYNPFELSGDSKFKHWFVQPEYRLWFCEAFNGTFIGLHAHGGQFNIADLDLPFDVGGFTLGERYQGDFYGAGIGIGHQWILGKRWSLEAEIGVGYAYLDYERYDCPSCSPLKEEGITHYFGPTKVALSLVYFFR